MKGIIFYMDLSSQNAGSASTSAGAAGEFLRGGKLSGAMQEVQTQMHKRFVRISGIGGKLAAVADAASPLHFLPRPSDLAHEFPRPPRPIESRLNSTLPAGAAREENFQVRHFGKCPR